MALDDIIRGAVATARSVVLDLHTTVQWRAWLGDDGYGGETYAANVPVRALVIRKQKTFTRPDGRIFISTHYLAILEPLTGPAAVNRRNPVDERDIFILPDGTTDPIVDISGFIDRGTGQPFFHEIYLGNN